MKKIILLSVLFGLLASSCKKDQIIDENSINQEKKGRFDNSPFKWDYQSNPSATKVFIGDLQYMAETNKTKVASANSVFIGSNTNIYPGGVYPESSIRDFSFSNEYPYEKNLYEYYFQFTRKFIVEDIFHKYGRGLKEYYKAEDQALNSQQFKDYVNATESNNLEYNSVEAYTYSDIEKNFSANAGFGKIFTTKMSQNKKSTKYKSIYFARLESSIFEVIFEPDYRNFFFDTAINNELKTRNFEAGVIRNPPTTSTDYFSAGKPIYVRNMSYGNYAYLAIESEYSYSEVKKAIEGTFNLWKINADAKYDQKTIDILSKSAVTLMISSKAKNSVGNETYWATSLEKLVDIYTVKYNEQYIGTPTFVELRDLKTNTLFIPTSINDRDRGTNQDRPTGVVKIRPSDSKRR